MALNDNGQIAETDGNKVHHQEEIVIVGGGLGGLCFAAALHRYAITRPSNSYHDLTRIRQQSETIVDRVQNSHGSVWLFLEQNWAEGCGLGKVRQAAIRGYCHRSLDQCNARPWSFGLGRPIQKHVYQLARVCSGLPHIYINCRSVVLGKLISRINYWNCLKLRVQYSLLINSLQLFCRQEFLNSDGKRLTILDFSTCEGG